MTKQKKQVEISYRILKIHTAKFSYEDIEEKDLSSLFDKPDSLAINMSTTLNIDREKSTFTLDINTALIDKKNEKVLIEHLGRTVYQLKGYDQVYNKKEDSYDLPDGLLIQLYSLAYTHSRALLATEISPTIYKDKYFLPVVNPTDFIKTRNNNN